MLIPLHRLQARLLLVVLAVLALYVGLRIYPTDLPTLHSHPDFLAVVFQSRALIFTGRVTLLCVAGFVVLSIVVRALNRQWLTKAGPFEVSTAADAEIERDALKDELDQAYETIRKLELELSRRDAHGRLEGS
ncbi:MAG TPA: hypothetical protein VE972_04020 [Conexibacter sp.]|nr:hypothetical protein [Conexibacter sp.]